MTETGSRFLQFAAAAAGNLNMLACAAILGWSSPTLPRLMEDNPISSENPLLRPITNDESSWIVSLVPLGVMFGTFPSGSLGEWLGRKKGLLVSLIPLIGGWILVGTAKYIGQMYAGRFILGLGMAVPFTLIPMYVGEISEVGIRGALGSFLQLFCTFGFLFCYAIGPYVSYTVFWILCASLYIGFFVCFMFMPESPYFLLSKGREIEATQALAKFRGKSIIGVQKEIEQIKVEIAEAYKVKTNWKDVFKVRVNRKATLLMCILMTCQQFVGSNIVLVYAEDIFRSAGAENTAVSAIIIGVVQTVSSIVTPLVVDKSGRKILLIISSIGCSISLAFLGVFFYLRAIDYDVNSLAWIPLTTLITHVIAAMIGWGPLPWAIMGEIFAPGVKPKASSICVCIAWSFSFVTVKFFKNIEEAFGIYSSYWFFSVCCAVNIVFIVMFLPETKGKTLTEIQTELSR